MSAAPSSSLRLRIWFAAAGLLIPSLTLVPLGAIWLWQQGYALYWVIGACAAVIAIFLMQLYVFRSIGAAAPNAGVSPLPEHEAALSWTPREGEAWETVVKVADGARFDHLTSWEAFVGLGEQTVEAVANTLHPGLDRPLWRFTVPEALTLIEQVSARLRPVITDNVPLGDRLTVAQVLRIYRWRSSIDIAQKGYDVWRVIRMLNPATAATQELRERLSRQMYQAGRDQLAKRLAAGYVKEVGRAAIDLYGGRLRVPVSTLASHVSAATERDRESAAKVNAEPLRFLIAGQVKSGKSSLVNALLEEIKAASDVLPATAGFNAYELKRDGVPQALLLDSPGLSSLDAALEKLVAESAQSDLIIWVSSGVRADRDIDRRGIDALRGYFAAHPNRRRPPMILVLTHIDRLRPFQDWHPPYDLTKADSPKAASIRAALDAAAGDLGFDTASIVPACLDPGQGVYNADAIWALIAGLIPDAQRAQLVRTIAAVGGRGLDWSKLRIQTLNAGRVLAETVLAEVSRAAR